MSMNVSYPSFRPMHSQRGVSLIFAMMTLVVLSLAAVALVRSVGDSSLAIGNLGLKQDATAVASAGSEKAVKYLAGLVNGTALEKDDPDNGYYASSHDSLDVTGRVTNGTNKLAVVDWFEDGGKCDYLKAGTFEACLKAAPAVSLGSNGQNSAKWVIMRLCEAEGAVQAGNVCSKPKSTAISNASDRGELTPGGRIGAAVATPYYRIVVRTEGARNTVSFTETIVHF